MNNKKIVIVGVLAVVVTMMVGYALFSETITINGTATAKGNFQLETSCVKGLTSEYLNTDSYYVPYENEQGGYENDYCTPSSNTVSYGTDLLYPGATRYFTIKIKNTGSIDAVLNLDTGIEENSGTACMDTDGDGTFETCFDNTNSEYANFYRYVESGLAGDLSPESFDSNGNHVTYERWYTDENTDEDFLTLKVGDTLYVIVESSWSSIFTSDNNKLSMKRTGDSVKFNFTQASN